MKKITLPLIALAFSLFLFSCSDENASQETGNTENSTTENADNGLDWKRIDLGKQGLSVEFPYDFKETNLRTDLDPGVNAVVKSMETFMHEQGSAVYMTNVAVYNDDVEVSLSGAVDGSVEGMASEMGGTVLARTDKDVSVSGHKGINTTGTVQSSMGTIFFQQTAVVVGQKMYQILGLNMVEDKSEEGNITRFVASAKIG